MGDKKRGNGSVKEVLVALKRELLGFRRTLRYFLPLGDFAGNLFIVGVQKAGTTALYSYLEKHPQLACGDEKEIHFFDKEKAFARGFQHYRSYFPVVSTQRFSLDATPIYMYRNRCAKRIYDYSSSAKIVMLLREPVSRAFSAFNMYQQIFNQKWFRKILEDANKDAGDFFLPLADGRRTPDIEYFLDREMEIVNSGGSAEEPSLIRRGIYAPQIERYVSLFGRDNVLILFSDALKKEPGDTVARMLDFVGLEPMPSREYPLKHVREYTADKTAREKIIRCAGELFCKDREDLIQTYGLNVPW